MTDDPAAERTGRRDGKSAAAFRTISEVASELDVPSHVLRFWETKFTQVRPLKRGGGRRYYRPEDVDLLRRIRELLYRDGYTIKGVQKLLREGGLRPAQGQAQGQAPARPAPTAEPASVPPQEAPLPTGLPESAPALDPSRRTALAEILAELEALRAMLDRGERG